MLGLLDAQGNIQAALGVSEGAPMLDMKDAQGKSRAVLMVDTDGAPMLALSDAQGRTLAALAVYIDEGAWLALSDAKGNLTWRTP